MPRILFRRPRTGRERGLRSTRRASSRRGKRLYCRAVIAQRIKAAVSPSTVDNRRLPVRSPVPAPRVTPGLRCRILEAKKPRGRSRGRRLRTRARRHADGATRPRRRIFDGQRVALHSLLHPMGATNSAVKRKFPPPPWTLLATRALLLGRRFPSIRDWRELGQLSFFPVQKWLFRNVDKGT